ncbi:flagellin [Fibrobacterota bacterium]
MRINFNAGALFAHNAYQSNFSSFRKTLEKLSTGMRINRASDDAAGLSISEELRTQVRGTHQAIRNVQDGKGLFQIQEGTLHEVNGLLQRIRELCIQASNDTLTETERTYLHQEATALTTEIDRLASVKPYLDSFQMNGTYAEYTRTTDTSDEAIAVANSVTIVDPVAFEPYIGKELEIEILQDAAAQELEDASIRSEHIQETKTGVADSILTGNNQITGTSDGTRATGDMVSLTTSLYNPLDNDVQLVRSHDGGVVSAGYAIQSALPITEQTAFQIQVLAGINGTWYQMTNVAYSTDGAGQKRIGDTDIESIDQVRDNLGAVIQEVSGAAIGLTAYSWDSANNLITIGISDGAGGFSSVQAGFDFRVDYKGIENQYQYYYQSYNKYQLNDAAAVTSGGVIQFAEDLYSGTDVPADTNGSTKMEVRINGSSPESNYTFFDSYNGVNNVLIFRTGAAVGGDRSVTGPLNGSALTIDYATATGNGVDWENGTLGEDAWNDLTIDLNEAAGKDGIFNDFWSVHSAKTITIQQANRNKTMTLTVNPAWTPTDFINAFNAQAQSDDVEAEAYWDDTAKEVRIRPGASGWKERNETRWEGPYFELSGSVSPTITNLGPGSTGDRFWTQNNFRASETSAATNSIVRITLVETGQVLESHSSTWNYHTLASVGLGVNVLHDAEVGDKSRFYMAGAKLQAGPNTGDTDGLTFSIPDISIDILGVDNLNLQTGGGARTSMGLVDTAIQTINQKRSYFGALINRCDHIINNLSNYEFNAADSESRIRDADFALQATQFAKKQIRQRASQAVIAQANAVSRNVLSLLDAL